MGGLLWLLIFAGLFYVMMRFGCGAHMVHGHDHDGDHGDTRDPVCGMKVSANRGYAKMHEGSMYRFCSRECLDRFEAEPDRYLKAKSGSV